MKLPHLSPAFQVYIPLSACSRSRQRLAQTVSHPRGDKREPSEWPQELISAAENSPKLLTGLDLWRQFVLKIVNCPQGSAEACRTPQKYTLLQGYDRECCHTGARIIPARGAREYAVAKTVKLMWKCFVASSCLLTSSHPNLEY